MATQLSLTDICAEIARCAAPSLFIDTCAALDIVRCAARHQPRVVKIAGYLIEAHAAGELLLIAPSVLLDEAARNLVEVESEARKTARKLDEAIETNRHVANTLGAAYPHATGFSHENLVSLLVALYKQLLATCIHVVNDPALAPVALTRAGKRRRPARGGGGANDCLLFEEFRSIAHAAPQADPLVLLTTNAADFGSEKTSLGTVHPEITADLVGTKARVCLSWDSAAAAVLSTARLRLI